MNKKTLVKFGALAAAAAFIWTGCKKPNPNPNPNPNPVPAGAFQNVVIDGACRVNFVPAAANHLDSTFGPLYSKIYNNTLFLTGMGRAVISLNDIDTLVANGATDIQDSVNIHLDHVIVVGNGLSRMNLNFTASDSIVTVSNGTGPYTLSGSTPKFHLYANGLADVHAFNLLSQDCIVGLHGTGKSEVYASNSLTAYLAGNGIIYYKGNPQTVNPVYIFGTGKLVKK